MPYKINKNKSQFDATKVKEWPAQSWLSKMQRQRSSDYPPLVCCLFLSASCAHREARYKPGFAHGVIGHRSGYQTLTQSAFRWIWKLFPNFLSMSSVKPVRDKPSFKPMQCDPSCLWATLDFAG